MSKVRSFGIGLMIKYGVVWERIGEEWRSIENLGEHGWWGNREIFGSLRSWANYGGNMEGVGKCGGGMAKCVGVWKRCAEVWKRGKVRWNGGGHTLLYTSPTLIRHLSPCPPHSPNTSTPHSPDTSLHTSPHSLTPFSHLPPHSPDTSPTPPPTLAHTLSFTPYQNFSLSSFIAKLV